MATYTLVTGVTTGQFGITFGGTVGTVLVGGTLAGSRVALYGIGMGVVRVRESFLAVTVLARGVTGAPLVVL